MNNVIPKHEDVEITLWRDQQTGLIYGVDTSGICHPDDGNPTLVEVAAALLYQALNQCMTTPGDIKALADRLALKFAPHYPT